MRPEAVGHGPPNRSSKSIEAAVQVAAARHLNLLRLDAYKTEQGSPPGGGLPPREVASAEDDPSPDAASPPNPSYEFDPGLA